MRFDLTDLGLFVHVADAGSITAGAARAGLALASASQRIRGMEIACRLPLLERGRRGVRPTAAGSALLHHARLVLQQMERLRGELGEHGGGLRGHIRLLCNTSAHSEFLPEALADFLVRHRGVDVDLEERPSHQIVEALAAGTADIGVVAGAADTGTLERLPFRLDRLVLAVPRDHALAGRRRVAFADAIDQDFVGLAAGSALQEHVGGHALRAGRALRLRVRVAGFSALCRMVEEGVGIAVVPETAARRCRRTMEFRTLVLTDPWAMRRLVVCVRRFDALPLHARRLVEHLRSAEE